MPWNAGQRREEQKKITINESYWEAAGGITQWEMLLHANWNL
jgi:hypothetical protein